MRGLTKWLVRHAVPHWENREDPAVRQRCGALSGGVGVALNILLAAGKFLAGALTGSLSMTADALNNLTDAASSVVTLVGFRVAGHKADAEHPFGHGRAEYVSGFVVSLLILLVALELGQSSVGRILRPAPVKLSWLAAGILVCSILVKLWMWRSNRGLSVYISSATLAAVAQDSISDCAATLVVLLGAVGSHFGAGWLDGVVGLGVALFIAWGGLQAARDTLDPLLGRPAAPELVEEITRLVLVQEEITGIHDLVVHEYGPGHLFATIHAEVPQDMALLTAHAAADRAEAVLLEQLGVQAVIHVDPVEENPG